MYGLLETHIIRDNDRQYIKIYRYIQKQHNSSKGDIFLEGKLGIIVTKYNSKQKNFKGNKTKVLAF